MVPALAFAKELRTMNMKASPLAPKRPVLKRRLFRIPVMSAVTRHMVSNDWVPYFSSKMGPTRRIIERLRMRCSGVA